MHNEDSLLDYVAGGGKLGSPDNVTPRYRGELMRLMAVFVDSELAGAAGFADCINLAPGLRERVVATRMVLDKFDHARQVLALMESFGTNTVEYVAAHCWTARLHRDSELGTRRVAGDMRLNVFHYPLQGWLDAVVMNTLMGIATVVQLDELSACSYQPLADTLSAVMGVERHHAESGAEGLRAALHDDANRLPAQAAVNYWYPRVVDGFGRAASDHFEVHRRFGLRHRDNGELLSDWRARAADLLGELGLDTPDSGQRS